MNKDYCETCGNPKLYSDKPCLTCNKKENRVIALIKFIYNSFYWQCLWFNGVFLLVYALLKSFNILERLVLWTTVIALIVYLLSIDRYLTNKHKAIPKLKDFLKKQKYILTFTKKNFAIILVLIFGLLIFNTCFRYKYLKCDRWNFYKIDKLFGTVEVLEVGVER